MRTSDVMFYIALILFMIGTIMMDVRHDREIKELQGRPQLLQCPECEVYKLTK